MSYTIKTGDYLRLSGKLVQIVRVGPDLVRYASEHMAWNTDPATLSIIINSGLGQVVDPSDVPAGWTAHQGTGL